MRGFRRIRVIGECGVSGSQEKRSNGDNTEKIAATLAAPFRLRVFVALFENRLLRNLCV
jgi:hypothetical protein